MSWIERRDRASEYVARYTCGKFTSRINQTELIPVVGTMSNSESLFDRLNVRGALEDIKSDVWLEGDIYPNKHLPTGLALISDPFPVINVTSPNSFCDSRSIKRGSPASNTALYKAEDRTALSVYLAPSSFGVSSNLFLTLDGLYGDQDPIGSASLYKLLEEYGLENGLKYALEPQSMSMVGLKGYKQTQAGEYREFLSCLSRSGGKLSIKSEIICPDSADAEEKFNAALVQMIDVQTIINSTPNHMRFRTCDMIDLLPVEIREGNGASSKEVWEWYVRFMGIDDSIPGRLKTLALRSSTALAKQIKRL